jgi:hypothetical protein
MAKEQATRDHGQFIRIKEDLYGTNSQLSMESGKTDDEMMRGNRRQNMVVTEYSFI